MVGVASDDDRAHAHDHAHEVVCDPSSCDDEGQKSSSQRARAPAGLLRRSQQLKHCCLQTISELAKSRQRSCYARNLLSIKHQCSDTVQITYHCAKQDLERCGTRAVS